MALANLPKGLSETFTESCRDPEVGNPTLQEQRLQAVLAAHRHLTTDESREALSVIPGDATWGPSNIPNNVYSVLAYGGCLIVIGEEELTVRVVHQCVKQYRRWS